MIERINYMAEQRPIGFQVQKWNTSVLKLKKGHIVFIFKNVICRQEIFFFNQYDEKKITQIPLTSLNLSSFLFDLIFINKNVLIFAIYLFVIKDLKMISFFVRMTYYFNVVTKV